MVGRGSVDAGPKSVTGARPGGADVGVAVVAVDAPGMKNSLMIEQLVTRPADVIHALVAALFLKRLAHPRCDVIENHIPSDALPLPFAALTRAPQRIANALRIVDLVQRRRPLGAVAPAAAGMLRITFEAANPVGVLLDESQEAACRFAVETDRRNDPAVFLNFSRPLRGVVLDPVVPFFHRRIAGEAAWVELRGSGIERRAVVSHDDSFLA